METKQVRDLQDEKYNLVQDWQDVREVLDSIGNRSGTWYGLGGGFAGCLLVEILDGDYGEVWAIDHSIPYLNATAYQIK